MAWSRTRARFEQAVDQHLPAALRLAGRLSGNSQAAEEIVQEAMLRASRSWRSFRGEANFRTWLFRIVINVHRDLAPKRDTAAELPDELRDTRGVGPYAAAVTSELGATLAELISKLPARQREVLVLLAFEGYEASEIAELLGITHGNVYANLHAARAKLKRELAGYLAEM